MGRLVWALAAVAVLAPAVPARAVHTYSDVSSKRWSGAAIDYVGEDRNWMRFGGGLFKPTAPLTRRILARAVVRAFAPNDVPDPNLSFTDLPVDDYWYRFASVAVKRGWLTAPNGVFNGTGAVSKRVLNKTLIRALGLLPEVAGLNKIATEDGYAFKRPEFFAYLVLADELGLNYNYPSASDAQDRYPWEPVTREFGAYALHRAATAVGSWRIWALQRYRTITLPAMDDQRRAIVEFSLGYAGYPYVYAGEWHRKISSGYCCGAQVHGGFDCSGFQWWVMRQASSGFNVTSVRPYAGYAIAERRASLIAKEAPASQRVTSAAQLAPADLVFFDADGDDPNYLNIDHGGMALGNGWFIHSSGSRGGVVISWMGDGWWTNAFKLGRRLLPWSPPDPDPAPSPSPTPTA